MRHREHSTVLVLGDLREQRLAAAQRERDTFDDQVLAAAAQAALRGHIALARVRFPKGTTGHQLDALARVALAADGALTIRRPDGKTDIVIEPLARAVRPYPRRAHQGDQSRRINAAR